MSAISQGCQREFQLRAIAHLRTHHVDKCAHLDDTALLRNVQAFIGFAAARQVHQQDNILKLISLALVQGFSERANGYPTFLLTQAGLDEATRMHNFTQSLAASPHNPVLISLDTDLELFNSPHP